MSEALSPDAARVAARVPAVIDLEAGQSYWWCTCGRSQNQPFCDGSHQGTAFLPLEIQVETSKRYALCQCKATGTGPFCDGAHKRIGDP